MTGTPAEVSQSIIDKLAFTLPGLSLEVGSVERKIVDAVGEAISEAQVGQYMTTTVLDIDTKSGVDLDAFVGIFGFGRLAGKKSSGVVVFSLASPAIQAITISAGTQIYVPPSFAGQTTPSFTILTSGVIPAGATSVALSAECTTEGVIGNVGSNTVTGYAVGTGVTGATNPLPFSGGVDPGSDAALRARFRATCLRNVAGTEDFYRALMLQADQVTKVNILGPVSRHREQLQSTGSGAVTSTATNVKYTWPNGWFVVKDRGTATEVFYTSGTDYTVNPAAPPQITPSATYLATAGNVYELEYEYTSQFSRNDPAASPPLLNKVDVYIDGVQSVEVVEQLVISSETFNTTAGNANNVANYQRVDNDAAPANGARFQRLGSVPVVTYPQTITVNSTTYTLGTNYVGYRDISPLRNSERANIGIVWLTTAPTAGGLATITYSYNRLPELMNSLLKKQKQITTDPLVHAARRRALRIALVIVYDNTATPAVVEANVNTALSNYLSSLTFSSWVQFSDIEQVAHNVPGVDNVRVARSTDNGTIYGVQRMGSDGTTVVTSYGADFRLDDDELASFASVTFYRRSANTFTV